MSKFVNTKDPGKLAMSGKVNLGKPRAKVSSNSGTISKQDKRGEKSVCFK